MKPTLRFCLLIFVCIVVVIGYALLPDRLELFLGWEPRQVPVNHYDPSNDTAKKDFPDEVLQDSLDEGGSEEVNEVDTAKHKILFIGDSMVYGLSLRLKDYATQNGHTLISVSWTSSTTHTWAGTDTLDYFMGKYNPTYIFVCIGSNEYLGRDFYPLKKNVRTMLEKMDGLPSLWIGPPMWTEDHGFNDAMVEAVGKGSYYRSSDLSFERQSDGRHPTTKSSAVWMDSVIGWMRSGHSCHPIMMDEPHVVGEQTYIILTPYTGRRNGATKNIQEPIGQPSDEEPGDEPMPTTPEDEAVAGAEMVRSDSI